MTFEEYKQGFKDVAKNNDEFDIKLYNSKVSQDCDFKVRVGELVENIKKVYHAKDFEVGATIRLSPGFDNNKISGSLIGVVTVGVTHNSAELSKPVVEEFAKFKVDHDAQFVDGSSLSENVNIQKDYGRVRINLMPDTDINDLIVTLDLRQEYMVYPVFVKALLKCNIIESQEQTLTK